MAGSEPREQLIVTHNGKKLYTEQRSNGYSVNCQVYMVDAIPEIALAKKNVQK